MFLQERDPAADVLETRQAFKHLHTVGFRHDRTQGTGNDGLDHRTVLRKRTGSLVSFQNVVHQQISGLVAVEPYIFTLIVADFNGKAVTVRIRCHQQFCPDLPPEFFGKAECGRRFGIGITDRCKVRIGITLFLNDMPLPESPVLHHLCKRLASRSVERCIDQRNVQIKFIPFVDCQTLYKVKIFTVVFRTKNGDQSAVLCFSVIHRPDTGEYVYRVDMCQHCVRNLA